MTKDVEATPIADEVEADLKNAKEEDLTHFEEDDDPLTLAGEFVDDEEGSGEAEGAAK